MRHKVINGDDLFDPRVFEELLIEWIAVNSIKLSLNPNTSFHSTDLINADRTTCNHAFTPYATTPDSSSSIDLAEPLVTVL